MQRNNIPYKEAEKTIYRWMKQKEIYLSDIHSLSSLDEVNAYLDAANIIKSDLIQTKNDALATVNGSRTRLNGHLFTMSRCNSTDFTLTITPPLPIPEVSAIIFELQQQQRFLDQNKQNSNDVTLQILTHAIIKIAGKELEQEIKSTSNEPISSIVDAEYGAAWQALELKHVAEQQNAALREKLREKQVKEEEQTALLQQMQSQISKLTEDMQQIKIEAANAKKQVEEQKAELTLLKTTPVVGPERKFRIF